MENKELSQADIKKYQEEINKFMSYRKALIWSSIGCFIAGVTFIGLAIFFVIEGNFLATTICSYCTSFSFVAGIVLSILKSALFNRRIRNRAILIEQAKKQQQVE